MKQIPILYSTQMVQAQLNGRKTMTRREIKKIEIKPNGVGKYNVFHNHGSSFNVEKSDLSDDFVGITSYCPYGKPGDIHWVREKIQLVAWDYEQCIAVIKYATGEEITFDIDTDEQQQWVLHQVEKMEAKGIIKQKESDNDEEDYYDFTDKPIPFIPSIHMPKWCARIYNRVETIKVEQLQDISESDAIIEGIESQEGSVENFTLYKDYVTSDWILRNPIYSYQTLWQSINGKDSWQENPFVWVIGFTQISITGKPTMAELIITSPDK